jgi:putative tryptophan/tyrosine transport system substrate-binding protein
MKRRAFIAGAGGTFVWSATARGQQRLSTKKIAVVHPIFSPDIMNEKVGDPFFSPFFAELRRLGYVEGENLLVERRSGEGKAERYAQVAAKWSVSNLMRC